MKLFYAIISFILVFNLSYSQTGIQNQPDKNHQPTWLSIQKMVIPTCQLRNKSNVGSFQVKITGKEYIINWKIDMNEDRLIADNNPEINGIMLQTQRNPGMTINYKFTPTLPFYPEKIIISPYNVAEYPGSYSIDYSKLDASGVTIILSKTAISSSDNEDCLFGDLKKFNMVLLKD